VAFVLLLFWGLFRPDVFERNQGDHPALWAARDLIKKRRYSAALDELKKAPPRSAFTADYRGLAQLGMQGNRVILDTTFETPVSRAKEAFREAIALDSEFGPGYLHLAICQALLREEPAAINATLARLPKATSATFPNDQTRRQYMSASGRELEELITLGKPFVVLVGNGRPWDGSVRTVVLNLGF